MTWPRRRWSRRCARSEPRAHALRLLALHHRISILAQHDVERTERPAETVPEVTMPDGSVSAGDAVVYLPLVRR